MNLRLPISALCALAAASLLAVTPAVAQTDLDDVVPAAPSRAAGYALSNEREEPADYVRDLLVLVNLGEGELAKPLMDELAGMSLTGEQLAGLVAQFGAAKIHRLARAAELGPAADQFAGKCFEAAGAAAADPGRLSELTRQYATGDKAARRVALQGLQAAGVDGALATITALAAADDAKQQSRLREALVRMKPLSTPLVAAALDSPNAAVRQQAAWALGQMGDRASIPRLAAIAAGAQGSEPVGAAARWSLSELTGVAFSPTSAEPLLRDAIVNANAGVPARRGVPGTGAQEGGATAWIWNQDLAAGDAAVVSAGVSREDAAHLRTAELAADLWNLNQGDPDHATLAVAYRLHAEWLLDNRGVAATLPGPAAADLPAETLSQALELATEESLTGSAIAIAAELGSRRNPAVLATHDGRPSPLAAALVASHPAVRFAALEAIMQINPTSPFPGSSKVTKSLLHFASSDGESAAVVAMPKTADAATVSGRLAGIGVQAIATNIGAAVVCDAADHPDVEFVIIDTGVLRPNVREVLFQVRRLTATANLPVVLLAADGQLDRAKQIAREHERVLAFPRPHSTEATTSIAQAAREIAPAGLPTPTQRNEHAAAAAGWIERLLKDGPSFYNVRAHSSELLAAVNRSSDIASTIPSLALVGTPESQTSLLNLANQDVLPVATRDAAAAGFDQSVQKHGLLLTRQQIVGQYDRYNASETESPDTQRVLGAVLDSIESLRDESLSGETPSEEPRSNEG
ncbi:hypothetical protein Pla123a_38280 [Posidoniimonas polymericola]|uniref:HEAT repeat protein n=1 Tax=Posidoniimonas polymericola TaxID=2528002 RepID=A0A5C5YHW5_9BACT|nr:HEAT repeat domain-containing protein [Posidoniimonas polymericola]TWT73492.1 hypothetical protein Pla123a_38280 [Posidoniimonas polymericola]